MIIFRLSWYGIIEANIISVYSFNISVVLEGLMFSYAFVDRFNLLKKQNEEAQLNVINQLEENKSLQTKVNRELEIKVQERTEDLKNESLKLVSANEKLEILMKQVNEMNSKLDFDNWQLNKKVTEEQKARVVSEQISYDEFTKVYPTEFSCLKYLEQLKWENDFYTCKKCANNKYIYLQKNLSRRCTKCSYIESATNGTIFQGLKFSITKAFYIVYYCTLDVQTMTVDELSDLLELRRNTCWSFRKRVLEHKESIPKSSKSKDRNKFNSLILNVID
jgi:ssDNA-binding Zn-finger/Zn-ribbon topoisomerase 1